MGRNLAIFIGACWLKMTTLVTPDVCLIPKGKIKKRAAVWAKKQRANFVSKSGHIC
jgi:hypothetical protein